MKFQHLFLFAFFLSVTTEAKDLGLKLIYSHHKPYIYDPQTDIFQPSREDQLKKVLEEALGQALMGSAVPVLMNIQQVAQGAGSGGNFLEVAQDIASAALKIFLDELERVKKENKDIERLAKDPLAQEFYFVPWALSKENLYYDGHKISQSKYKALKLLPPAVSSQGFESILTRNIKRWHEIQLKDSKAPAFLLGVRNYLFIKLDGKIELTTRVLVGVRANPDAVKNFSESNPPVILDRVAIPELPPQGLVANLTFTAEAGPAAATPKLEIKFGQFKEVKDGNFILSNVETGPLLDGTFTHPIARNRAAIRFTFTDLTFDVDKGQFSSVKSFISGGFRIGKTNYVFLKIRNGTVDEQFKDKINESVRAQAKGLMEKILSFGGQQ